MIKLQTSRLSIIPLNLNQFQDLLQEKQPQDLDFQLLKLDEDTHIAMQGLYQLCVQNQDQWWWFTNWQIVLNQEHKSIGSCCFVHAPDESGTVEIGYGIDAPYRHCGYMTEAAKSLCQWALSQKSVLRVIAQTDRDNFYSQKVLIKCGMKKYSETQESCFWELL